MPIYEYECKSCGRFEVMQKITEEPLTTCEKCGKDVQKLVSLSSFALVGGGWYKDLYSSTKPGADSNEAKMPKAVTSDTKSEKSETKVEKTESKPEAKVEAKVEKPKPEAKPAAPAAA